MLAGLALLLTWHVFGPFLSPDGVSNDCWTWHRQCRPWADVECGVWSRSGLFARICLSRLIGVLGELQTVYALNRRRTSGSGLFAMICLSDICMDNMLTRKGYSLRFPIETKFATYYHFLYFQNDPKGVTFDFTKAKKSKRETTYKQNSLQGIREHRVFTVPKDRQKKIICFCLQIPENGYKPSIA